MKVKINTPWNWNYEKFLTSNNLKHGQITFEINNDCIDCDFWIVWGDLKEPQVVNCPPNNVIYITDEAHELRIYNQRFIEQFSSVWAVRSDLRHPEVTKIFEPQVWYFNKNFDEVYNAPVPNKQKKISIVSSDLAVLNGHKKRFAFVNKLIGYFGNEIDVYGRGFNEVVDKWDAIAPYQFSIAIENNVMENYFTEKFSECLLTYTVPVYYGCPNIDSFFDPKAFVKIDIDNFQGATKIIRDLIEKDCYAEFTQHLVAEREKYFKDYFFFSYLKRHLRFNEERSAQLIKLFPERFFTSSERELKFVDELGAKKLFFHLIKLVGKRLISMK